MCSVVNLKPDLPPVDVRVKELETAVDELRSELAVKSTEMDKLKNENKTLTNKYVQLKRKLNVTEEDPAMASHTTVLDSLEQDPEVCIYSIIHVAMYIIHHCTIYIYIYICIYIKLLIFYRTYQHIFKKH